VTVCPSDPGIFVQTRYLDGELNKCCDVGVHKLEVGLEQDHDDNMTHCQEFGAEKGLGEDLGRLVRQPEVKDAGRGYARVDDLPRTSPNSVLGLSQLSLVVCSTFR
jgi:hypothetical protein